MADLWPDGPVTTGGQGRRPGGQKARPRIVREYDYTDSVGRLLYQAVRLDPKSFRQRRPDGRGGWAWDMEGVGRVLYRLPRIVRADVNMPVFVVEGEKDVQTLEGLGFVATCNVGGAGKWQASYSRTLAGRRVVICPDNDAAGEAHAAAVAGSLMMYGAGSIRLVRLPGLAEHGDVSDWAARYGQDREAARAALIDLARAAPEWASGGILCRNTGIGLSLPGKVCT